MDELHTPVLLEEVIDFLRPAPGMVCIDGTLGRGGHAEALLGKILPGGRLLGIDDDPEAIREATDRLHVYGNACLIKKGNFRRLGALAVEYGFEPADAVLLDLGVSSPQFDRGERGFSFMKSGPLDMRFSPDQGFTAAQVVNSWSGQELGKVIREYGEERFWRGIVSAILARREEQRFITTVDLSECIKRAVPAFARYGHLHPATRTFQALRMTVNDELGALEEALPSAVSILRKGGRLAVISFHSLEDRIVKRTFLKLATQGTVELLTKRPVITSFEEAARNPRARSAKLRVVEKK